MGNLRRYLWSIFGTLAVLMFRSPEFSYCCALSDGDSTGMAVPKDGGPVHGYLVEDDAKQVRKPRAVHRIVIIPDRSRLKKRRPTSVTMTGPQYHSSNHHDTHSVHYDQSSSVKNGNPRKPQGLRYHEMHVNEQLFKDNYYDSSSAQTFNNGKDDWKPLATNQNQILQRPDKYVFKPVTKHHATQLRLTARSKSTTSKPQSLADVIELTTTYPQKLPPIESYYSLLPEIYDTSDQSSNYASENVKTIKAPRSKAPKIARITSTTARPYEVYEDVDDDFPLSKYNIVPTVEDLFSTGDKFGSGYGKRIKPTRRKKQRI